MLHKLLFGSRSKHPRWRDEKGNFVGFLRLVRNGPRAGWSGLARIILKRYAAKPWISYDAIDVLERFLKPDFNVLEFGSGSSTAWYARHSGHVYSVEDNPEWFAVVQDQLSVSGLVNVTHQLVTAVDKYAEFGSQFKIRFDFIMVDGKYRSQCIRKAIDILSDGGLIYLDNSDKHSNEFGGDTRIAEELLLEFAETRGAKVVYFTDFAPAQFFAQQGMLVQLPAA